MINKIGKYKNFSWTLLTMNSLEQSLRCFALTNSSIALYLELSWIS